MDFVATETVGASADGPALKERTGRFVRNVAEVKNYDFRRPHRVSKERLLALEAMYERLVKSLEGWLVGRVRTKVELSLNSVEQISFSEFTHTLSTPCAAYLFRIQDSGGMKGVIDMGPAPTFSISACSISPSIHGFSAV